MRSPVETRWDGDDAAMLCPPVAMPRNYDRERGLRTQLVNEATNAIVPNVRGQGKRSGMRWEHAHDVVVHGICHDRQEEDEANLHEALFKRHAEVPAHDAFDSEQQYVSAVKNGNGQKIQDAEIHADQHHQRKDRKRAFAYGFTGGTRNTHHALQLFDGNAAAEKSGNHANGFADAIAGGDQSVVQSLSKSFAAIGSAVANGDSHLINFVAGFGYARDGLDLGMNRLALTLQIQLQRLAFGAANAIDKLSPILNFLAVDGLDDIAFFQTRVIRGTAGSDFVKHRLQRRVTQQVGARGIDDLGLHGAARAVIFDFGRNRGTGAGVLEYFGGLLPRGIFHAIKREDFVARLERAGRIGLGT